MTLADDRSSIGLRGLLSRLPRRDPAERHELLAGPIRGELLGPDQLAEKARSTARRQILATRPRAWRSAPLLARLTETRGILTDAHARLMAAADRQVDAGPAGDWLLDNFHVLQEHIREVRETLPRGYYRELPEIASGPLTGYPRVYEMAITLISHSEARIDRDNLDLFVRAFQEIATLRVGELWALPAMFRLALIESVRRTALRTVRRLDEMELAEDWAARIEAASALGERAQSTVLDAFVGSPPPLSAVLVSHFLHRLRLISGSVTPLAQIEQWIAERALGAEEATTLSTQHLAHTQVIMANSITSLRTTAQLDWKRFVEGQCAMEAVLRRDPAGFYERMTFDTRDRYRHVVERIARRTDQPEPDVAARAVELAHAEVEAAAEPALRAHIGYFLVDEGRAELDAAVGYRSAPGEAVHQWVLRHPNLVFVGGFLTGTAVALAAVFWLAGPAAWTSWLTVLLVALLPAADIALSAVNQLVTAYMPPRRLSKLDLHKHGITAELRTAVVVPTLFGSVDAVEEALTNLEVQFLANREANLHFALLGDFTDAATERVAGDEAIVAAAVAGVRALNERYAGGTEDAFYLLHRPRRWNPRQGVWMGWERKRGKLAQLNRFLRGGDGDAFSTVVGDLEALRGTRYVITLDADTVLPPNAAPELIGALAHPLNRAVCDPESGRVVRGYGILQPRVGVSLPSAHRSHFAAIHSGHPGVDPYTAAVSDVYQDLYGEGSFTGKGIYDVDAFERATHGRFPENALLSHDLIEGSYARAGLATEVSVYDDYPASYLAYTRRKHRWIRGDWQLLGWLKRSVPGPDGQEPNRLSILSRWKILDNLRRSTVEIGQLVFLFAGWTVLPGLPLRWTALGLAAIGAPWIVSLLLAVLRPPLDKSWRAYYFTVGQDARTSAQQFGLAVAFLPHQAWVSADAIARTLWRLFVSRRLLLAWQSASHTERAVAGSAREMWRAMGPGVAVALAAAAGIVVHQLRTGAGAPNWQVAISFVPLFLLWTASPAVAHALSGPAMPRQRRLSASQQSQAMRLALLHWRFFDRFVSADTQWLAPDNFQEDPDPVLAMRTSPTNLGLQLLAIGSARDLGFVTTREMTRRLELVFRSFERMRRYRGHFYNWYELQNLQVLEPAYVSSVDSGNLAGHLIALRQGCLAARAEATSDPHLARALHAALELADERLQSLVRSDGTDAVARTDLSAMARRLDGSLRKVTADGGPLAPALLAELTASLEDARAALSVAALTPAQSDHAEEWIVWALRRIEEHEEAATAVPAEVIGRLDALAERAHCYVSDMDFRFLFDEERELFSIGYHPGSRKLDASFYDLLASESRLGSFVAIAKNDVPVEHWFRLGRALTHAAGETALVSWSGSMFEYLMPALVMRSFPATLLDLTSRAAVRRQVAYGEARGVPWGLSESAYNVRDRHLTYQYRAFGVPDLALKRGLAHELVVAPYASALAALVDPERALANLTTIERKGALGPYGFRDALDYTRPDPGERYAVVGAYMAHHIGMSLVALSNALTGHAWPERFHADPLVRSASLLLHERIPRRLVLHEAQRAHPDEVVVEAEAESPAVREFDRPDSPYPHVALLGRLPYTVMVTHCGGGYSRYGEVSLTRWRSDGTSDATGQFCYVKDVTADRVWSTTYQPVCAPADAYRAIMATDRVTFRRSDGDIETRTEVVVVPEDSAEVRRVTVTNHAHEPREIELTSYGEIVLGSIAADRAHPAFANLFVETEWHEWCTAITATRRPRSTEEPSLWCVHVVDAGKERARTVSCETDRARFLGRGATPRNPAALTTDGPLSGTTGAVLDPIFALRTRVRLAPGQSASVAFTTLVATSRERAFELADRYHDPHAAQRSLDLTWTTHQAELRELDLSPAQAAVFQELAGALLFPRPELRIPHTELARNRGSQPLLWENSISGDWPIVLATIGSVEGLATLRQLLQAHHYWRRRGMTVDLVIVNDQPTSYFQVLHHRILDAMFAASDTQTDRPGGVFVRRRDLLGADAFLMLRATARVVLRCDGRPLAHVCDMDALLDSPELAAVAPSSAPRSAERPAAMPPLAGQQARNHDRGARTHHSPAAVLPYARLSSPRDAPPDAAVEPGTLILDNGLGGLTTTGAYQIRVRDGLLPPMPWANVVANPHGGFVVSESGAGVTWAANSYFFRLTPWHNDPVSDPASEALYLRDADTGDLWSATPAPIRRGIRYDVRHDAGTSVFECEHRRIATRLTLGMAEGEAVKLSVLRVTNHDAVPRRIAVTAYAEWTLGVLREHTQHQVHTTFDPELGAVLAQNFFDPQYAQWVAFCALTEPVAAHTADRREFLGRNGSAADPEALRTGGLGGTTGAGFDPCAALACVLELAPGETREIAVTLGAAEGAAAARATLVRYRDAGSVMASIARSVERWRDRLSVVTVRTPEPSFDAMLNQWTLYQALACRMWARSALYQSSGAYGFRDQLQDVLAFVYAEPGLAREHIVRASGRQFIEGDVQHWWHPQSGRGVRTRSSDDLVWLPYCADRYVRVTGDQSVLDESVPYLTMRPLEPHEHEVYDLPALADEHASVYEHCLRALRRACTAGVHGLPLMGGGDWNDGMNRVGVEGRGESVWLAWFLIATLESFAEHASTRGDDEVASEFRTRADGYAAAVESAAWDGAWYRRALFEDGAPLGSSANDECRIDSIAQSWSVISGAGAPDRQVRAMRSLEEHLVRPDARLILLLTPPFDRTDKDPGYIKGYVPGVRENGAQYTHAALWAVLATALRGDGDRALELFQMLNPLTHTRTADQIARYQAEPYAVAADVYTALGHLGRAGWTWYTGSASWMYRVGLETILGFTKLGDELRIDPCVPRHWPEFAIEYRHGTALYAITVRSPGLLAEAGVEATLDGRVLGDPCIPLVDDGLRHEVVLSPRMAPTRT